MACSHEIPSCCGSPQVYIFAIKFTSKLHVVPSKLHSYRPSPYAVTYYTLLFRFVKLCCHFNLYSIRDHLFLIEKPSLECESNKLKQRCNWRRSSIPPFTVEAFCIIAYHYFVHSMYKTITY